MAADWVWTAADGHIGRALYLLVGFGAGIGITLTGVVVAWVVSKVWKQMEYRMAERVTGIVTDILQTRAAESAPDPARQRDIAEAFLFDFAEARDRFEMMRAKAEHVAAGGSPDDPPTKWKRMDRREP